MVHISVDCNPAVRVGYRFVDRVGDLAECSHIQGLEKLQTLSFLVGMCALKSVPSARLRRYQRDPTLGGRLSGGGRETRTAAAVSTASRRPNPMCRP